MEPTHLLFNGIPRMKRPGREAPVSGDHKHRDLVLQVAELGERLTSSPPTSHTSENEEHEAKARSLAAESYTTPHHTTPPP